jgi:predicted Zn-dependent protease
MTPDDYPIQQSLSQMLADAGRFEEAAAPAREHVRLAPGHTGARAVLARALLAVGDTASAIAHLDSARAMDTRLNADVPRVLFRVGLVDDAVDASRRMVDEDPESVFNRVTHARLLFETAPWGQHSAADAMEALEEARRMSPGEDFVLGEFGRMLRESGRTSESLAPFETIVAAQPNSADSHSRLGWELLVGQRDAGAAGRSFRRALELNPVHDAALWGRARVEMREGRADSAYAAMDRVLDICGWTMCQSYYGARRAWLHAVGGDEDGAREMLREYESMRNHPDWNEWLPVMAVTHAELGDLDRAFELLDLAYDLRSTELLEMKAETWFDPLRGDPRFDAMLTKMKLE